MVAPTELVIGHGGQASRARPTLRHGGFRPVVCARPELDFADHNRGHAALRRTSPAQVVSAAARIAVDHADNEPPPTEAAHSCAPRILADAAQLRCVAIRHLSSDGAVGGCTGAPDSVSDRKTPRGSYDALNPAGEWPARTASPRNLVLRAAWVCSDEARLSLRTALPPAVARPVQRVVADQFWAPTFAGNLDTAITPLAPRRTAASAGDAAFGLFHLTSPPHTSTDDAAAAILAGVAARGYRAPPLQAITTVEFPTRAVCPADGSREFSRIVSVGATAERDWRGSLERALDILIGPQLAPLAARPTMEGFAA
jgi:dTDP-4-dehydrorhamnose reductase